MLQIPTLFFTNFCAHLVTKGISPDRFQEYKKWLHFFLDFCEKYQIKSDNSLKLRLFIDKLKEKNQSFDQRRLAYHAVSLYFDMLKLEQVRSTDSTPAPVLHQEPREQIRMEVSKNRTEHLSKGTLFRSRLPGEI